MTTIRLPNELERNLNNIAINEHTSKSEIIKIALNNFIREYFNNLTPYDFGKNLFGKYGSDETNNSQNYKKKIKDNGICQDSCRLN